MHVGYRTLGSPWDLPRPFGAVLISSLLALTASGCVTGLGPRAVRIERPDFNQEIARSADAEMLLDLVRLRYNDSPLFLELGGIVAQYSYDASFSAASQINGAGPSDATVGAGLGYSEKPTVTYTPLLGDEFAERMLTPIPLDSLMLFSQPAGGEVAETNERGDVMKIVQRRSTCRCAAGSRGDVHLLSVWRGIGKRGSTDAKEFSKDDVCRGSVVSPCAAGVGRAEPRARRLLRRNARPHELVARRVRHREHRSPLPATRTSTSRASRSSIPSATT